MSTILEDIFKNSKKNNKVSEFNNEFFKNYLDYNNLLKLIDIRKVYLDIVNFDLKKIQEDQNKNQIKEELKALFNKKNNLENENFSLLKKKINIVKALTNQIDIKKIEIEEQINKSIIENVRKIDDLSTEIENKNNLVSLTYNSLDKDMLVNTLKYKINNLNGFAFVDVDFSKKEDYIKQIKNIIKNDNAVKCYTTYLFEMIQMDLNNLHSVLEVACEFINYSYQKNDNLSLENKSLLLEFILNSKLNLSINNYLEIILNNNISNNKIDELSKEKLKHNTIIHTLDHFAKNYKELLDDKEIMASEYNIIKGFISDLKSELSEDELFNQIINDTVDIFKFFSKSIE